MALASFTLDPTASTLTDNQHVDAINAATIDITRAGSVSAVARPIEALEVSNAELSLTAAQENLNALGDVNREYIKTRPVPLSGDFPVVALQRTSAGLLEVEFDDVPV